MEYCISFNGIRLESSIYLSKRMAYFSDVFLLSSPTWVILTFSVVCFYSSQFLTISYQFQISKPSNLPKNPSLSPTGSLFILLSLNFILYNNFWNTFIHCTLDSFNKDIFWDLMKLMIHSLSGKSNYYSYSTILLISRLIVEESGYVGFIQSLITLHYFIV